MVSPGFLPTPGGVEKHVCKLTEHLSRIGVEVEVLTASRDLSRRVTSAADGYRVTTFPAWRARRLSISPRLLAASLRRRRGAVTHVHNYHALTALALMGAGHPVVFTPHYHGRRGHFPLARLMHLGYSPLARSFLRRCDAVICVSEAERRNLLADFPFLDGRVEVIPNGVDVAAVRAAAPYPDQPATVMAAGRLEPHKGFDHVIRGFALLPAPTRLVIVGDGSQRGELSDLVERLGLGDRIRLLGHIDDDALCRWFRTAAVFVSLSDQEAFGMAPLEAAAAGARTVLSDIPAHRDLVHRYLGATATLCAPANPQAVADAIAGQLGAPAAPPPRVPDWAEVAELTATVYAAVRRE